MTISNQRNLEFSPKTKNGIRICTKNPDYYSVFWAELLAIEEVLNFCITESVNIDIWIMSGNRSSIQHLPEWGRHGGQNDNEYFVKLLNYLSADIKIFFHWVPSHVNICGNEIADGLIREGSCKDSTHGSCLTFSEIATRVKQDIRSSWIQAPVHQRYEENRPGAALIETSSGRNEAILARLSNGHTRTQPHVASLTVYLP
ncbi:uncharacterized protein TNCV_2160411 [Trichonephila clavipes]|nr:uncharacterized protein TNCV_2160411 [Trichonephila clavipes]